MKRKGASIEIEESKKKKGRSEKSINHRKRGSVEIREDEAPRKKKRRSKKSIQSSNEIEEEAKKSKLQICKEKFNKRKGASIEIRQEEANKRSNQQFLLLLLLIANPLLLIANPKIPKKKRSIPNRNKSSSYGGEDNFNQKSGRGAVEQQIDIAVNQAMEIHFEEEILMDILSRLPVQSLLRFKCVSKSWKALISVPCFKMKHLRHAKNDQTSQKLLISQSCPKDGMYSMYCCPLSSVQLVEDVQELDFPSSSRPRHCVIRCCCDGLVIIECTYDKCSMLLLWNPSTRESTLLPDPEFPLDGRSSCLGLGFDSTSGDYKILKIQQDVGHRKSPSEVLTLKSGSWRRVDKHPRGICDMLDLTHTLAFVHDAFHWIGCFGNYSVLPRHQCVVSFSISDEVYAELPLPEQIMRGRFSIGISVLEGMLCVHADPTSLANQCYKLWLLKDYGDMESWNPLFTIEDPFIYFVVPKYRFADGEVLFWCCHAQTCRNAFRTSSGPFALWPEGGFQNCIAFKESLISPRSLTY